MPKIKTNKSVRLPSHVTPQHYKLQITPDMEAFTFAGQETIKLTLDKTDKKIILHSKDLEILDGWYEAGKTKIPVTKISYQDKAETATLNFAKTLPQGKGKLVLHFRGVIAESLRGFYRSHYEHLGETKHIATTQFESTDARRAFPCFDEPAHKAVFELSLVVPKHLTAISNTIESGTPQGLKHDPSVKVISFKPSPKMSTYLLAYIIGDFESIETKTKDNIKIRAYTTKGKKKQAQFALDVAKKSLEFMNEYFAIKYPLPVLDLISLPDFSSAAMENWGAVTFREVAILVDEEHTSFANRQRVAETVVHELVHQWFGNLVTMEWWTYLWLNESFASFMASFVVDKIFPEWNYWTKFVLRNGNWALDSDGLKNTHPIEVEVHHPDQISEIFDGISYAKGASVLRMLHAYLGPENFRDGLRHYLKKHSYKNTSSIDLWDSLEKVSKKPVREFMHDWITKEGYPLVKIGEIKPGKLFIEQSRFTIQNTKYSTIWPIPLQFEEQNGQYSPLHMLRTKKQEINLVNDYQYLKANPEETGFYRTMYSPQLLAKLYDPIQKKAISVVDRLGVIRDLGALIKSGQLPTSAYLEFVSAFKDEDSYVIWSEICGKLNEIYNIAQDNPKLQQQLAKYYLKLFKNSVELVGWEAKHKESASRGLLRALILYEAGAYGDKSIQRKAKTLFAAQHKKPIPPDLRATVYRLVAKGGDAKTFGKLFKMAKSTHLQEEQRRLYHALFAFEKATLFQKAQELIFSKHVRGQDATILIFTSFLNEKNRELAWKWLTNNWVEIAKRYDKDHLLIFAVEGLEIFASSKKLKEIANLFKKHPAPSASRAIQQVLEKVKSQADWIKRDRADITNCLKRLN